jgi:hypothetical protein
MEQEQVGVSDSECRRSDRESCSCTVAVFMERSTVEVLYEDIEAAEMNRYGIIDLSKYMVHTVRSQVIASTQRKYGDPYSTTPAKSSVFLLVIVLSCNENPSQHSSKQGTVT